MKKLILLGSLMASSAYAAGNTCPLSNNTPDPTNPACRLALRVACQIDSNGTITKESMADGRHVRIHSGRQQPLMAFAAKAPLKVQGAPSAEPCLFSTLDMPENRTRRINFNLLSSRVTSEDSSSASFRLDGTTNGAGDKNTWVCNAGSTRDFLDNEGNLFMTGTTSTGGLIGVSWDKPPVNADDPTQDSLSMDVTSAFVPLEATNIKVSSEDKNDRANPDFYTCVTDGASSTCTLKNDWKDDPYKMYYHNGLARDCAQALFGSVDFNIVF